MRRSSEKGQILNEAIVAMGIVTVGVVAIFGFITRAISQGRYIADQTAAVNLASEGVEVAKNILDANALRPPGGPWNSGFNPPATAYYQIDYTERTLTGHSVSPNYGGSYPYSLTPLGFQNGYYAYGVGTPSSFVRTVRVENISGSQIRVTSRVDWRSRNQRLNTVSIASDMFDWR
jgi:hypothetical protein